jgi:poly-gamma-glutamate capsule biosynthesis protein CapA/YwtB (metallophosphatase superfamily)
MGRAYRPLRGLSAILALAIFAALSLVACPRQPKTVAIHAEGQLARRLARIVEVSPLPAGWAIAHDELSAKAIVTLAVEEATEHPKAARAAAGRLWLAPALPLADPRFTLSPAEAQTEGLEDLESIEPPRRACAIDRVWPGEEGYPFVRRLELSARAQDGGSPPRELAAWVAQAAKVAIARDQVPARLCAVGDIQVGAAEAATLAAGGAGLDRLLRGGLLDELRRPDVLVGNLEGPVSGRGSPNPHKRFLFRMPPGTAKTLMSAGFDLLLFANNHAFDYGEDAFHDTLSELKETGLAWVGGGSDAREALSMKRIDTPGGGSLTFVGFASFPPERLGFTTQEAAAGDGKPGINADENATLAAIASAASSGETVIVLAHGGDEYVGSPPPYLRDRYRRFADAGAALVVGSHPHVLQGIEAEKTSLIAYSLGNFLFTGLEEPPQSVKSAAVSFLLYKGKARGVRIAPIVVDPRGTTLDPDRASAELRFSACCAAIANTKDK